jgi:hypothetical protein
MPDMLRQPVEIDTAAAHVNNIRHLSTVTFFISILPILATVISSEGELRFSNYLFVKSISIDNVQNIRDEVAG